MRRSAVAAVVLLGGCLSTPARPRDDAMVGSGGDAPVDASKPAAMFVSRSSGMTQEVGGSLAIPPPSDAIDGDLVVLYLDRFWASTPAPAMNGWHSIADITFDMDAPQILWRTAVTDEAVQANAYTFMAGNLGTPPDAVWVREVWRGASSAQMLYATFSLTPTFTPMFPAAQVAANEIVIDASVSSYETSCDQPTGVDDRVLWASLANPPGSVPAITFTCMSELVFGRFQIRIVP